MSRRSQGLCCIAALVVLAGFGYLASPCAGQVMKPTYLRIDASSYGEFTSAIEAAENLGAVIRHRFYPYAAMGVVPQETVARLTTIAPILRVYVGPVPEGSLHGLSQYEVHLAKAYNNVYFSVGDKGDSAGPRDAPGGSAEEDQMVIDLPPLRIPEEYLDEIKAAAHRVDSAAPPAPATSEYMLGHIAVGVIMPESRPGYGTQNWTSAEEGKAVEEVISAMDWWAKHSPNESVRFSYDINYRVPISLEPLDVGGMPSEPQWAMESLEYLGYSGVNRFQLAYQYVDDLRARYGTDWGFLVFILHGREGQAFGRALAYAYLGGPYNVNAYSNGRLGPEDLDRVIAHETGHTFFTLDEYASAPITCMVRAGYLHVENANKEEGEPGCKSDVPCVMRGSSQEVPFFMLEPCYYTQGQIGWWDTDGDGIPDILDKDPVLEFVDVDTAGVGHVVSGDTLYSTSVSLKGTARAVPIPNRNSRSNLNGEPFTVEHVGAEYRVDGGIWTSCEPADGRFDSSSERFNLTAFDLSPWIRHTVDVRAVTAHGNATPDSAIRSFEWFVVPPVQESPYFQLVSSNPTGTPVSVNFAPVHPLGGIGNLVQVEVSVFDAAGRRVAVIEAGRFETGKLHTTEWDGTDSNGSRVPAGVYLIAITSHGRRQTGKVLLIP